LLFGKIGHIKYNYLKFFELQTSDNNNETTSDNGFNSKDKDGFKIPSLPTIVENPQKKPKKSKNILLYYK
jgi:hypothetical protein